MYMGMASLGLALQAEIRGSSVTAQPFSFCLPGYRETMRRCHFIEGGLHGLGFCLVFLGGAWLFRMSDLASVPGFGFEWLKPLPIVLAAFGLFSAGVTVHTAASILGYSESWWARGVAIADGVVWLLLLNNGVLAPLHSPIVWFQLMPLWLMLGLFSWIRLRNTDYLARGHRMLIRRRADWSIRPRRTRGVRRSLESLFLGLMHRHDFLRAGKYCWGELYENLATIRLPWMLLIFPGAYVLFLSILKEELGGWVLTLLGFLGGCVRLSLAPGKRVLLVPAGRRERALATRTAAVAASAVVAGLGLALVAVSQVLAPLARSLPWKLPGLRVWDGIDVSWFYWPCLLVPWVIASRLFRGWVARVVQVAIVLLMVLLWTGLYVLDTIFPWRLHALYICVLAGGWLLLLVAVQIRRRAADLL